MPKVLAIDPGERRIGVAVSDEVGLLARPLVVVLRRSLRQAIAELASLIQAEAPDEVIVGVPVSLSGHMGPQAQRSLRFAEELRRSVPVPVRIWNEQYSTIEAERRLAEARQRLKERKAMLDAVAAAVVLQDYLDARK